MTHLSFAACRTVQRMRQILPEVIEDIDVEESYLTDERRPTRGRPWVVVNMASTLDGATALTGRSGGIGGRADRLAFHALRSAADVIMVGAGTVRSEHYGPVAVPSQHDAARRSADRSGPARLAIVTRSLDLDPDSPLFTESARQPYVLTTSDADPARRATVAEVAEVLALGTGNVDLAAALGHLGSIGTRCVLVEGGPTLNGQLVDADLIDEWCWTIGPLIAGGASKRGVIGADGVRSPLRLDRLITDGRDLLFRYLVDRTDG